MTGWALLPAFLPSTKLLLPTTNRRMACLSMDKPMLYFSIGVSYGSQRAAKSWTLLSLTKSSPWQLAPAGLWAQDPSPNTHHQPHISSMLKARGGRSQSPARTGGIQTGARFRTETRLTKVSVCCIAQTLHVAAWPPGPNIL